ncbi:MAG TPA: SpoIID/LytB domain-containing protein, partial [bacterium]|nr:SpoIID/LytB domain-containing protein [bacterium]
LEVRYNETYDRTWVINELKMEYYLRGLAETSNVSHIEFQKSLLTAARTYAFYHWQRATKHKAEGYHVDAYLDQVYRGYSQEAITPRITEAVEATRGQIVTYNGATAITAYFSRSDGRTRDWSEVWGGDVPWSKGVAVPCDEGKTLWGHGVGMSASGALCMANNGQTWDSILKYFYTGVDLGKKWK